MRLRQIEVFRAVMLTGSVSGAAKLLNVTQPAVTTVLRHAEDELDLRLFERIKGRLHPTPEGRTLYAEVERTYTHIEGLRALAASLRGGRIGCLRISALPSLSAEIIPLAVSRFLKRVPGVNVHVETHSHQELLRAVLTKSVDLGFTLNPQPHTAVESEVIAEGDLVALFPAAMGAVLPERVGLNLFHGHPFVGLHAEEPVGLLVRQAFLAIGVPPISQVEVKASGVALTLVENGAGVAIVDPYAVAAANPSRVAIRRLQEALPFSVGVVHAPHHARSIAEQHFINDVVDAERDVARGIRQRLRPCAADGPGLSLPSHDHTPLNERRGGGSIAPLL